MKWIFLLFLYISCSFSESFQLSGCKKLEEYIAVPANYPDELYPPSHFALDLMNSLGIKDKVWSYDEIGNKVDLFAIESIEIVDVRSICRITISFKSHCFFFDISNERQIWIDKEGWKDVSSIQEGNELVNIFGDALLIVNINRFPNSENNSASVIEIETAHNFYFTELALLVHNPPKKLKTGPDGGKVPTEHVKSATEVHYTQHHPAYSAKSVPGAIGADATRAVRAQEGPGDSGDKGHRVARALGGSSKDPDNFDSQDSHFNRGANRVAEGKAVAHIQSGHAVDQTIINKGVSAKGRPGSVRNVFKDSKTGKVIADTGDVPN